MANIHEFVDDRIKAIKSFKPILGERIIGCIFILNLNTDIMIYLIVNTWVLDCVIHIRKIW